MKPKQLLARCGEKLRQIREEKLLSVDVLATLTGVDADVIKQFEDGNGTNVLVADLLQIADALDTDICIFFSGGPR